MEPFGGKDALKRLSCFFTASLPLHTLAYTENCSMWYPSFSKKFRNAVACRLSVFVCTGRSKKTIIRIQQFYKLSLQYECQCCILGHICCHVQIRHGPERLHQVIRQIKLVQLTVMVQTQARLKTIHRQSAVGHNSPPLGREGLPFFFFHRGIIAKDIDLIFLNFLYYAKRQTFKEVCPFMGFYPNSSV